MSLAEFLARLQRRPLVTPGIQGIAGPPGPPGPKGDSLVWAEPEHFTIEGSPGRPLLLRAVPAPYSVFVFVNGQYWGGGVTVTDNIITFDWPPWPGAQVTVRYQVIGNTP